MIGDKIYKFRKAKGLSQEEFARSIGVTRQIVSKWESNEVVPGIDKIKKITEVFGISYDEFMGTLEVKRRRTVLKYVLLFGVMVIVEIIMIVIYSNVSGRRDYRCLGTETYYIEMVYDSDDVNYNYVTIRWRNDIRTVLVNKVIASQLKEGKEYEFIFRSNDDNDDVEYIFKNNEIINIREATTSEGKEINEISCR